MLALIHFRAEVVLIVKIFGRVHLVPVYVPIVGKIGQVELLERLEEAWLVSDRLFKGLKRLEELSVVVDFQDSALLNEEARLAGLWCHVRVKMGPHSICDGFRSDFFVRGPFVGVRTGYSFAFHIFSI